MYAGSEGEERCLLLADAEVVVEFDDEVHSQGDRVRGRVTVLPHEGAGGDLALHVGLREVWKSTEDDEEAGGLTTRSLGKTRAEVLLEGGEEKRVVRRQVGGVSFCPAQCYRFSLPLADNSRISGGEGGWQFVVRQEAARATPDFARVDLAVQPAEEFLALSTALTRGLRFREVVSARRWDSTSVATVFRYLPPPALQDRIDTLELELLRSEGVVRGNLVLELEERSIGCYFKSLLGLQREERGFEIPRAELSAADSPAIKALSERLRQELAAALDM